MRLAITSNLLVSAAFAFAPAVPKAPFSTELSITVGLGPDPSVDEEQEEELPEGVEVPNHEEYRTSRRSKIDKRCDEWYGRLLQKTPDGTLPEELREKIRTKLMTPVELVNEFEVEDRESEEWTPYVSTRLPWTPLVPAYGLEEFGLPVPRRNAETWRHFDVPGLINQDYSSECVTTVDNIDKIKSQLMENGGWLSDDDCEARLIYVNGVFVPDLSKQTDVTYNVEDTSSLKDHLMTGLDRLTDGFTDALATPVPNGDRHETSYKKLSFPDHSLGDPTTQFAINAQQGTACFAALNTLKARGVAVVDAPANHNEGVDKAKPTMIINALTNMDTGEGYTLHPRTLVVSGDSSILNVIQQCVDLSVDSSEYHSPVFYNGYTQVYMHANANLTHSYVDETGGIVTPGVENPDSEARQKEAVRPQNSDTHFETLDVHLMGEKSAYEGTVLSLGGSGRVRIAQTITLLQPETFAALSGFSLAGGIQRADIKTNIHHIAQGTKSDQVQKNMIGGRAIAAFRGRIRVEQSAQQTDSAQLSRTVLLSDKSRAWAVPSLEIIADDVQCAHGATVSDLPVEEMFYLQSRGLDKDLARNLLMFAFVDDICRSVDKSVMGTMEANEKGLQQRIVKRLQNLVPKGDRLIMGEYSSV